MVARREKGLKGVGKRGNSVGSSTIVGANVRSEWRGRVKLRAERVAKKKESERKNRKNATGRMLRRGDTIVSSRSWRPLFVKIGIPCLAACCLCAEISKRERVGREKGRKRYFVHPSSEPSPYISYIYNVERVEIVKIY